MPTDFGDENEFLQWNEEMAHKYDPDRYHTQTNAVIRWIEHRRVKAILSLLGAEERDRVLEVGCGAGNVLEKVRSGELYGIDLSQFLLGKSQQRLAQRCVSLAQANAEHLPLPDGSFRKLICTEVLEHVVHPRGVISEMARVATTDATIIISVPNEEWIDQVKRFIVRLGLAPSLLGGDRNSYRSPHHMTDEWHLHRFHLDVLRQTCEDSLAIEKIKAIPSRLIPLRYVARCRVLE
jgi:ubiquinone/menaquinone biosynthesis C-methylase UbiE